MRYTLFILWFAICWGCELPHDKPKKEPVFICGNALITDSMVLKAKPKDTIAANGVYVKYYIERKYIKVQIGCRKWEMDLGGYYQYNDPKTVIPTYEWSSDKVIALSTGCGGNYCSHHFYYVINSNNRYDRDDVLANDRKNNLITYMVDRDSIVIENIYTTNKIVYPIKDTIPCAIPMSCYKDAKFSKGSLSVKWQVLKKGKDKIITSTFNIPEKLYNN